jgi:hypothetical protein
MDLLLRHRSKPRIRRKKAGEHGPGRESYIGGVGDELAEEDLLVGVEGVDDEREELVDLGLEGEGLGLRRHGCGGPELLEGRRSVQEEAARVRRGFV